jgi:hypothetical protein
VANTQSNLTGNIRHIHATVPVAEAVEGLSLSLSSQEGNLAQVDLANIAVRRSFGRKVLRMEVIDRSGFAEIRGEPVAMQRIRIPLGHSAIIGRNQLGLPLLESEIISEEHVTLTYTRGKDGDNLSIHDNVSANGSHIIDAQEETWQERSHEISGEEMAPEHTDVDVNPEDYKQWLYGATDTRYPALEQKS